MAFALLSIATQARFCAATGAHFRLDRCQALCLGALAPLVPDASNHDKEETL